jgi:hypothetical protein
LFVTGAGTVNFGSTGKLVTMPSHRGHWPRKMAGASGMAPMMFFMGEAQ